MSMWLARRWNIVVYGLWALSASALFSAVVLHPSIISAYVSSDGQLEPRSRQLLYAAEAGTALVGIALAALAVAGRRHTAARERLVLGVAFAFGSVLVCVLLMEVGLRAVHTVGRPLEASRHYFFAHDPVLGWRHRPGSVATFKDERVSINSVGLRDDELAGKDRFRILFLGDSQLFGDGVSHEDTFTERLSGSLPGVDAINAGVIGYGTDQQLLYFERDGISLEPGLTVVALNAYDLRDNISKRVRSGYEKPMFEIRGDRLVLTNVPIDPGSITDRAGRWLTNSSHLYGTVNRLARGPSERNDERGRGEPGVTADLAANTVFPPPAQFSRALDVTRLILARLAGAVRGAGGRMAVMFLPYRMDLGDDADYQAGATRLTQALEGWSTADGYAVLDLRVALRSTSAAESFLDAMHLSPKGHEAVARAARDWLIGTRLVPSTTETK